MDDYYYDFEDAGDQEYAEYYDYDNYDSLLEESLKADEEDEEIETARHISLKELYEYCMIPTTKDSYKHLIGILLWPFLFLIAVKIFSKIVRLPNGAVHLLSLLFGSYYLWQMFEWKIGLVWGLLASACIPLLLAHLIMKKWRGSSALLFGIIYLVSCELSLVDHRVWHAIRGIQMVVLMKITSLGFDMDSERLKNLPSIIEIVGYVFHPGSVLFGPWVSFTSYKGVLLPVKMSLKWFLKLCLRLLAGTVFLLVSTCVLHWLVPDNSYRFLLAYRDALSFRTSHYFVSFLSEVSCNLGGIEIGRVSRPSLIEFPRSLVEVVINWNIPMHHWLKTYIFKTVQYTVGVVPALILTYGISALFHGLNFQLASVLLSLSFYTYTEYTLREKLADVFNACIASRKCRKCEHKFNESSMLSRVVNFIFGCISLFHLTYLGMMFDASPKLQESGYNMIHTLKKWSQFGYSSHWVALACYIVMAVL